LKAVTVDVGRFALPNAHFVVTVTEISFTVGENAVIWPGSVVGYKLRTRSASAADYELTGKS